MSKRNSARLRGRLAHSFATRAGLAALLQLLLAGTAYAADEDAPLIPAPAPAPGTPAAAAPAMLLAAEPPLISRAGPMAA